jgi:hypothetical protein
VAGAATARATLTDSNQKRWGLYSIQRVLQAGVHEEAVPDGRGEVVFYNLGKFSHLISDFEAIHFHSKPVRWTDGGNVWIDFRWGAGDADRFRRYAAETVALAPDIIRCYVAEQEFSWLSLIVAT